MKEWEDYKNQKLNEMPKEVVKKAVDYLSKALIETTKEQIRTEIDTKGAEWNIPFHHGWGTAIRNLLRTEAELADNLLPDGNWDDYYAQCVEIVVGRREYNFD